MYRNVQLSCFARVNLTYSQVCPEKYKEFLYPFGTSALLGVRCRMYSTIAHHPPQRNGSVTHYKSTMATQRAAGRIRPHERSVLYIIVSCCCCHTHCLSSLPCCSHCRTPPHSHSIDDACSQHSESHSVDNVCSQHSKTCTPRLTLHQQRLVPALRLAPPSMTPGPHTPTRTSVDDACSQHSNSHLRRRSMPAHSDNVCSCARSSSQAT